MIALFPAMCEASTERVKIDSIHYKTERLSKEQLAAAILVESLPEPENRRGMRAVLYANPQTKEVWYEYVERPPTDNEILQEINEKLDKLLQKWLT